LATTPSRPAPSKVSNQRCAVSASWVIAVTCTGAGAGQRLAQPRLPLGERRLEQRLVAEGQQVEGDEGRRGLLGQQVDPRLGRVDALQQRLEVQPVAARDDDLAVDDARSGRFALTAATTSGK
jgi:hypothetical protein